MSNLNTVFYSIIVHYFSEINHSEIWQSFAKTFGARFRGPLNQLLEIKCYTLFKNLPLKKKIFFDHPDGNGKINQIVSTQLMKCMYWHSKKFKKMFKSVNIFCVVFGFENLKRNVLLLNKL